MANRLQADEIRWILSLDAKGVQSELATISSKVDDLTNKNKELATDLKLVEKLMKESEKEMQRLERRGDTTSVAYQRASASFSQLSADAESLRTEIGQNTQQIDAFVEQSRRMINTTQVQNLTMNQLRQRSRELQIQLDETSEAADPEVYRQLGNELSTVNRRMEELGGGSNRLSSIFQTSLGVFFGNMLTKGVDKLKEWVSIAQEWSKESIELAKGALSIEEAYNSLPNSTNMMKEMKKATSETVSELELMKKAIKASEFGIPIDNMGKLLDYARRQAAKFGTDVNYMVDSIVDGIGRKSTLILDNLGLSATKVQSEVKKTGDFSRAVINIVNGELKKQGDYVETSADKAAQAGVKWENAQLAVGKKMMWLGELWDKTSGQMADRVADLAGGLKSANDKFDDQLSRVANLNIDIPPLVQKYEELSQKVKLTKDQTIDLNPEQQELLDIINQISSAVPGAALEFDKYGRVISLNTNKIYEYIDAERARLKWIHRETIKETEESIEDIKKKMETLQEEILTGKGFRFSVGGSGSYKLSDEAILRKQQELKDLGESLQGAEEALKHYTGATIEEHQKATEEVIIMQQKFNGMTDDELNNWVKLSEEASKDFKENMTKAFDGIADKWNNGNNFLSKTKGFLSGIGDFIKEGNEVDEYTNEQTRKAAQEEQARRVRLKTPLSTGSGSKTDKVLLQEKKKLADMLEKLEIVRTQKLADINKDYLDGKIKTESEYNRKIYAAEQSFLTMRETSLNSFIETSKRAEAKQDATKQLATVQEKMLAQQIKYQKEVEKILLDANPLEKEKQAYAERLDALGLYGKTAAALQLDIAAAETEQEKEELRKKLEAFLILEKQYQENVDKIKKSDKAKDKANAETLFNDGDGTEANQGFKKRKEELQTELNDLQNIAAANPTFDAEMAVHLKRLAMIQEEIDARRAAGLETTNQVKEQGKIEAEMSSSVRKELEGRAAQFQQYGNAVGQALGNVMTGQETALKAFGDASVDIVFDILQKIIEAELVKVMAASTSAIMRATAEAMSTPQSALTFGASGFATAAILTGAISAATMVAKTALKGLLNKKSSSSSSSSSSTSSDSSRSGSMTVKQRAKGKYDVVGQDDGQLYQNVPYMGEAKTGIVSHPTLMGERGSELVVSAPDFLSLRKHVNYPLVVQAIQDARFGRVPQRAEGKYNNIESTQTNQIQPTFDSSVLGALTDAIVAFNNKKLNLGMTELQAEMNKMNETNKRYTRKS